MPNLSATDAARSDAHQQILTCLDRAQAVSIERVMAETGLSRPRLLGALDELANAGAVHVLRPVASASHADRMHVRRIRPTDNDYLWEQHCEEPRVLSRCRMRNLLAVDEPAWLPRRRRPAPRAADLPRHSAHIAGLTA